MSRKASDQIFPRRLRLGQQGIVRQPFSWRHGRGIFDPSKSYYLAFLFAFYAFGLPYLIFFMVVSSFGSLGGLQFSLDRFFGSDSVNVFSEEFTLGDTKMVELIEKTRRFQDQATVFDLHIVRGGAIEVNAKGVSDREFWTMISAEAMDVEIVIRSDPDATYGDLMHVLDTLERAADKGLVRRENVYILGRAARLW